MHLVGFVDSSCLYQNNRVLSKSWLSQCNEGKQKQMSVKMYIIRGCFEARGRVVVAILVLRFWL